MQHFIVTIGASAGGIEALRQVVGGLPDGLPAAVCVAMHMPSEHHTHLPAILNRSGPLRASLAQDNEPLEPSHIYVAPPGRHLQIDDNRLRLADEAFENGFRPSIDVLFRSAAHAVRERAIGVILSGLLDDGVSGLRSIERHGGIAVVQDPADAAFDDMPRNAIASTAMPLVLTAEQIGPTIGELVGTPRFAAGEPADIIPQLTGFGCPACGGVLREADDGRAVHFACRIGHSYGPESLLEAQNAEFERGLWMAIRTLEEQADVYDRLLRRSGVMQSVALLRRFEQRRSLARARAATIRGVLFETLKMRADLPAEGGASAVESSGEFTGTETA